MQSPAQRMSGLLDYLVEQAKDVDPAAFTLSKATEFQETYADLEALPWVDFNVETDGESIWLRVHRLEATRAQSLSAPELAPFLAISDDPAVRPPAVKEAALASSLIALCESGFERDVYTELFNRVTASFPKCRLRAIGSTW